MQTDRILIGNRAYNKRIYSLSAKLHNCAWVQFIFLVKILCLTLLVTIHFLNWFSNHTMKKPARFDLFNHGDQQMRPTGPNANGFLCKTPFHWTAIPLRFEILVKMTRIVTETARSQQKRSVAKQKRQGRSRSVSEFQILYKRIQKRNESVTSSPRS